MSLSIYQASIPTFLRTLGNLSAILKKAAAHAEAKNIDPRIFIDARLAPDMFPWRARCRSPATPPRAPARGWPGWKCRATRIRKPPSTNSRHASLAPSSSSRASARNNWTAPKSAT